MNTSRVSGRAPLRVAAVAVIACSALSLGTAEVASAGTYHVYGCRTPSGVAAPADGWSETGSGSYVYYGNTCASGGSLNGSLDGAVSHPFGDNAFVTFTAPQNTDVAAVTLWRAEVSSPGQPYGAPGTDIRWNYSNGTIGVVEQCNKQAYGCGSIGTTSSPMDPSNALSSGPLTGVSGVAATASCGGGAGGTCPATGGPPAAAAYVYAADITLRDPTGPSVSGVQGPLVAGGTLAGTESVSFNATDTGSGVYSVIFNVDGQQLARNMVDSNGGRCVDFGGTTDGTHAFEYVVPCKLSVGPSIDFDTTQLAGGSHHLRVLVDDAAGNATTVFDGQIAVNNGPTNTSAPQLTDSNGTQSVYAGDTLNVNQGQWNPTPTSFSYAWQTCNADGTNCQAQPSAASSSYSVSSGDLGRRIVSVVTARTSRGSTTLNTAYSPVVQAAPVGSTASGGGLQGAIAGPDRGAGIAAVVGSPPLAHIANGVTPCGSPTLALRFGDKPSTTIRFGKTATLHGELKCGGAPVRSAVVSVASAPTAGSVAASTGDVTTANDGTFAYVAPPGPSRNLTATYKAYADDAQPQVSAVAKLSVTPGISLKIAPPSTRNHRSIFWRGRVAGGPMPAGGLPLDLQYREGKHWHTFDQIKSKPNGTFSYRYRFRRTTRATVYTFRVALPAGGVVGYPYAPASSMRRSVRVRP